jgi:hypothetical protein
MIQTCLRRGVVWAAGLVASAGLAGCILGDEAKPAPDMVADCPGCNPDGTPVDSTVPGPSRLPYGAYADSALQYDTVYTRILRPFTGGTNQWGDRRWDFVVSGGRWHARQSDVTYWFEPARSLFLLYRNDLVSEGHIRTFIDQQGDSVLSVLPDLVEPSKWGHVSVRIWITSTWRPEATEIDLLDEIDPYIDAQDLFPGVAFDALVTPH